MDISKFNLEDVLLSAMKSETESNKLYLTMSKKTQNGFLQDKLKFLADEEIKHKQFIEELYMNHFPDKKIILPQKTAVPLPEVSYTEQTAMSELLGQAMNAELAASEFYKACSELFESGSKIHNTFQYFSDMENGHFKMLEAEKQSMQRFEDADVYWPMVHAGP